MASQKNRKTNKTQTCRHLIVILGDQLDRESAALEACDKEQDIIWMAEVSEESTHIWTHKARITLFLSAMRHHRDWLNDEGYTVDYRSLGDSGNKGSLADELAAAINRHEPDKVVMVEPGEWRVREAMQQAVEKSGSDLDLRDDTHFLCTHADFEDYAEGKKQLRMEYFYRRMRKQHDVLMEDGDPAGGEWNFDKENRNAFGKDGPKDVKPPKQFEPDTITREVMELVEETFSDHPGSLDDFGWPVTPEQARKALKDFVKHRLPNFGRYQDAMWTEEPFLNHSLISAAMNLKLLNPREAIEAATEAYQSGDAPIESVEGFVRQILGWREYVRGIYWRFMPDYLERNALKAKHDLPEFYWDGDTEMACLKDAIGQTLRYGYAHHIQRLMVTGLFGLLYGVDPKQLHEWYLAVYVDAVEWVELPNTLGMSQFADGGEMASKPYAATGKYIQRMSNYCKDCPYDPKESTGDQACPFTTLYWDFLQRHESDLSSNRRMTLQLKNLDRLSTDDKAAIRKQAKAIHKKFR